MPQAPRSRRSPTAKESRSMFFAHSLAVAMASALASMLMTRPVSPTSRAARKASRPVLHPRSSTVQPSSAGGTAAPVLPKPSSTAWGMVGRSSRTKRGSVMTETNTTLRPEPGERRRFRTGRRARGVYGSVPVGAARLGRVGSSRCPRPHEMPDGAGYRWDAHDSAGLIIMQFKLLWQIVAVSVGLSRQR